MDHYLHTSTKPLPTAASELPARGVIAHLFSVAHQISTQNWPVCDLEIATRTQHILDMAIGGFFPIELQLEAMLDRMERQP